MTSRVGVLNERRIPSSSHQHAQLLLKLLRENRFPRIWVPSPENRDPRQLFWHRHRLVQMRTRIMNQLQALAMNEGKHRRLQPKSVPLRGILHPGFSLRGG